MMKKAQVTYITLLNARVKEGSDVIRKTQVKYLFLYDRGAGSSLFQT